MAVRQASSDIQPIDGRFMTRVFHACVGLAALSLLIMIVGRHFGTAIVMAGNTEDASLRRIAIGDETLLVPANTIRFSAARHDGPASRIELYVHWPDMQGYSLATRDDFDGLGGRRRILFLTILPREMTRDMSGRFDPIYSHLIESQGKEDPSGLTAYRFVPSSGYLDEELLVARTGDADPPFVARCLLDRASTGAFAGCERDIQFGENLEMRYRFPRGLLGDWKALDEAVRLFATSHLQRPETTSPASPAA